MSRYHVRVIGGWCGNRIIMVSNLFTELFAEQGLMCRVTHQSVWETYALPPNVDLILQLMPAFTEEEAGCQVINIRPMVRDLTHAETIDRVLAAVRPALERHFELGEVNEQARVTATSL